jgi:hypothetical protein
MKSHGVQRKNETHALLVRGGRMETGATNMVRLDPMHGGGISWMMKFKMRRNK